MMAVPRGRRKRTLEEQQEVINVDYKDERKLRRFISDRGKIVPRRMSGLSERAQRNLTRAIKRARHIALLPYVSETLK